MGYRSKASGAQIMQICSSVLTLIWSLAALAYGAIVMQAFFASDTLVQQLDGCQNGVPLISNPGLL